MRKEKATQMDLASGMDFRRKATQMQMDLMKQNPTRSEKANPKGIGSGCLTRKEKAICSDLGSVTRWLMETGITTAISSGCSTQTETHFLMVKDLGYWKPKEITI